MKRILVLNHNREGEATWHRAWNFSVQLQKRGAEVTFLTLNPKRSFRAVRKSCDGIAVELTPYAGSERWAASGLDLWDILWRTARVLAGKWEVLYVFSSLPSVGLPQLVARGVFPRRCVISDWDDLFCDGGVYEYLNRGWTRPIYLFERWLETVTRKCADGVSATSRYLFEKAVAIRNGLRVEYIPAGTNAGSIPCLEKRVAREKLRVPEGRIVLGYMGGGYSEDGMLLIRAAAIARKSVPNLYLHFINRREDGYERAFDELGLRDCVHCTGWVPYADVPTHLAVADILVMPLQDSLNSRARGPIKLRDYLCAGRPIVGTALGEVDQVLRTYDVGLPADLPAESLAQAIVQLARQPEIWERLGQEARRVAEREMSWDIMGERIENFVRTCCAATGKTYS